MTERSATFQKKLYNSNKKAKRIQDQIVTLRSQLTEAYNRFDIDHTKQILIDKTAASIPSKLLCKSVDNDQDYDTEIRNWFMNQTYPFLET